jgi:ABC-type glycerol-3-phosphate transport system substrate-binding protein
MVQMTGAISPRLNNLPDGYLEKNEWFAPFQEASDKYSESIMPAGLETYGNEVLKIISDQIELILYSDVPIDEALAQAQSEVVALVGQ